MDKCLMWYLIKLTKKNLDLLLGKFFIGSFYFVKIINKMKLKSLDKI